MHLVIPFTLLIGSILAAAASIQHTQISVEITNTDAQDHVDARHSSEPKLVMKPADQDYPENLSFNFTLGVQYVHRGQDGGQNKNPSFGFKDLEGDNVVVRGEIGFATEFAFRNGKLINGNKALGTHPSHISPGWTSLFPLKGDKPDTDVFDLLVWPQKLDGKEKYVLEFANTGKLTSLASILTLFIPFNFRRR